MRKNVHGSTLLLKKNWKQSKCRQTEWNLSNSEISLSSMEKKRTKHSITTNIHESKKIRPSEMRSMKEYETGRIN